MTWDTFTKAIEKAKLENGTQAQILISLFKSAGCIIRKEDGISESAVKKWINGSRNCKVSSYFPNNQLENIQGAYNFFRRRPESKLKKLQQILSKEKDEDSPIDCETKDMDILCWSLVNQFIDLLGLQRLDIPISDELSNLEIIPDTVDNEISRNVVVEQSSNSLQQVAQHQKNSQFTNEGAKIAIPQDCKICLCCRYWNGDVKAAYRNTADEYGECKAIGKRVLAADGVDCDKFKENYNRITIYKLSRELRC